MSILQLILIFLFAAVIAVVIFRMLNLPPLLGYLTAGALIAPYAKSWIPNAHLLESIADFGVVFLMFSIGLEFSLSKLKSMKTLVAGLGGGQVLLTTLVTVAIVMVLGWSWQTGVIIGLALAMSSTAIGGKMLDERMELDTEHGHAMFGILLLQDMMVAPILVVLPLLSHVTHDIYFQVGMAVFKIFVIFLLLFWLGKPLIQWWFRVVAARHSHELFMLNLLLITLGGAYLTSALGLSTALGALLVGMMISETEFRFQVEEDIKPFKDILLGLFFITVGMMIDPKELANDSLLILGILAALLFLKGLIVFILSRLFSLKGPEALKTALGVCAAGEFGFVILSVAQNQLADTIVQPVLAAMVVSMFLAPFLIIFSDKIAHILFKNEAEGKESLPGSGSEVMSAEHKRRVIICGYGQTGAVVGKVLDQVGIGFIAIESDAERVREAQERGEPVEFGDCAQSEILVAAGLKEACALIVSFDDKETTAHILEYTQRLHPKMPVIVRTNGENELEDLLSAGATEVIPDVFESALALSLHALAYAGIPVKHAIRIIRSIRRKRYGSLRGILHGERWVGEENEEPIYLVPVSVPANSTAIGQKLSQLRLTYPDIKVSTIQRGTKKLRMPDPNVKIQPNDVITLIGKETAIEEAEGRLLRISPTAYVT